MAERTPWPALEIRRAAAGDGDEPLADLVAAVLDDHAPLAIEDLTPLPVPPGGLWDPTVDPLPEAPAAPLAWRAFFTSAAARDAAQAAVARAFPGLVLTPADVPDEDWAARSQRALTAVTAGAFVVAPPWDRPSSPPAGVTVIVIEPSRGFGTGHHASTRLCLRAITDSDVEGRRVLDLGTGSGVLALAASARGARSVTAVDVDADAIEAARASAALNPWASEIAWVVGDFRDSGGHLGAGPWDVVVANLTGGMLRSAAARIRDLVRPGGRLIVSGFDRSERAGVEQALAMRPAVEYEEDGWVGLGLDA